MEEVTRCSRLSFLAAGFFFFSCSLNAQRPLARYQQAMEAGRTEPRVREFVATCLHAAKLPKPVQFYTQGAWFTTPDLALHMKQQGSDDDGTAQVWLVDGKPRVLSQWTHDDEFDRHTLACLRDDGTVVRQINEYTPGLSEPDLHWTSIHSFVREPDGQYRVSTRFTDWNGNAIIAPRLTSEDRDFIAGERSYEHWKDFDLAGALERTKP